MHYLLNKIPYFRRNMSKTVLRFSGDGSLGAEGISLYL